jgi:hypothetical protein
VIFWDEQRSFGHHRCVTHLYGIPMWNFYQSVGWVIRQLADDPPGKKNKR